MTNNQGEYENIDDTLSKTTQSVYLNPVFDDDDDDEATTQLPLLDNSNNDEQSPYEEVAANISNKDDPTMLCLTFRSVFIGILLTCLMAFTAQFFAYRTSPLIINAIIIIVLSYMIGQLFTRILPEKVFNITLNPGPFSVKEHALITIMAIAGPGTIYSIEVITIQRLYYHYYLNHFNAILFLIIMHLLALSIAGILKRYLVWPASMIWPETLLSCGLIRTLTTQDELNETGSSWTMTRSTFFWFILLVQFVYYWLPGYIFPLLSFFSFVCMIAPHKIAFSQITGANGLGLGAIELDWSAWVGYLGSPVLVPFWAHVNMFLGFIIGIWVITPILYYTNVWEAKKMPIVSNRVFDIGGNFYSTSKVLDRNLRLNETAYQIYGPVRMSTAYAMSLGFVFAGLSSLIAHTALYYGKSIVEHFRSSLSDKKNDIHATLMSHYPDVSERWYYLILLFTCILGFIHAHITGLMPGYIIFVSVFINIILMLPLGLIEAITSLGFTTNIPADLLSYLLLPGDPIGFLAFRNYTYSCQTQLFNVLINFKIAHYLKIPPRVLLPMMILSVIIASIVNYITALYLLNHVPNICTAKNPTWKCLNVESSYSASIIWGVVGSVRMFGPSSDYFPLLLGFLGGLILPVISWSLCRMYPNVRWLTLVHIPILLLSINAIPPAPAAEYPSWFLVGFIFNYVIYRYAHLWWEKYAYIFSAAMSCGVALGGFVIFFIFQNNSIFFRQWWGTGGSTGDGCPLGTANFSGIIPTDRNL